MVVSAGDDGTVAAVQRDGTCARRYGTAGSAAVKSAAFLPGKGVLCCGCSDRTVRAYHADSCALLATVVDVHMDAVVRLDAAPLAADGRAALASADLSGVVALHVFPRTGDTAVLAGTFAVPDGGVPVGLALAPRQGPARALFVASASGTVTRWDCAAAAAGVLGAGAPVPAWTTRTHAACQALARAGDAAVAVVGSGHNVALVHGDTGRVTHKWKAGAAPGAPSLTCVDCTKDGGVVAVGTAAGTVLLYDVRKTSAPFATAVAADGRRVTAVRFLKATGTAGSGTAQVATQSTRSVSQRRAAAAPPPAAPSARAAPSANSSSAGAVQPSPIQKRTVHLELDGTVDQIAQVPRVPPAVAAAATTWDTTVSSDVSQEASLNPPPSKQPRAAQSQRALVESARALMAGDSTAAAAAPWMAAGSRSMASSPPRLPPAPAPATGGTLTQRLHHNHHLHPTQPMTLCVISQET